MTRAATPPRFRSAGGVDYGEWGPCRWHANPAYGPHGLCGICLAVARDDTYPHPETAEGRQYARYTRHAAATAAGEGSPFVPHGTPRYVAGGNAPHGEPGHACGGPGESDRRRCHCGHTFPQHAHAYAYHSGTRCLRPDCPCVQWKGVRS